jgi:Opioid growth factor receptor (OGFr) conserved region
MTASTAMPTDPVVTFYSGGKDNRGRTLEQILEWPDAELEARHDYIQWVFPTEAPSAVNPRAPLVTTATRAAFQATPALRERLGRALDRLLRFYGMRREADAGSGVRVVLDPDRFSQRAPHWLHASNHNHLRLTRIMQSLAALGLGAEARALQRCLLDDVYDGPGSERVSRETYEYWLASIPNP